MTIILKFLYQGKENIREAVLIVQRSVTSYLAACRGKEISPYLKKIKKLEKQKSYFQVAPRKTKQAETYKSSTNAINLQAHNASSSANGEWWFKYNIA